jgi:chain length determinant protein (polysaccharide antigen chain regulator)
MSDEINITSIINRVIDNKKAIIFIVFGSILMSVIIALSQVETFKASAHLIPPENKYTQSLNVFLDDGYRLSREEISPTIVYRTFVLNLQSRKYQRRYFFDNKLYNNFDEDSHEKSFEKNFHDQMSFKIESKIVSRDYREEQFLTVSFIHTNPQQAATWLNDYIDMVNEITSQDYVDGVNILISNTRNIISSEISGKKNLSEQVTEDRIVQLEEALQIALDLGITDRSKNLSNQQNVILGDDENIQSKNPIYLYGSEALLAEINALKKRTNKDSFIRGLRQLEQKAKSLDSIKVHVKDVNTAQLDQRAIAPENRYAPKRKLIVLLGVIFGSFIAFLYIIFSFFITRKI